MTGGKIVAVFLLIVAFKICALLRVSIKTVQYYGVLLDKDVNWQEFTEHYEIEKARGRILIVQEVKDE